MKIITGGTWTPLLRLIFGQNGTQQTIEVNPIRTQQVAHPVVDLAKKTGNGQRPLPAFLPAIFSHTLQDLPQIYNSLPSLPPAEKWKKDLEYSGVLFTVIGQERQLRHIPSIFRQKFRLQ